MRWSPDPSTTQRRRRSFVRSLLAALTTAALLAGCADDPAPAPGPAAPAAAETTPFAPAPPDAVAAQERKRHHYARITRPTPLRRAPGGAAITQVQLRTEFGTHTLLGVLRRKRGWLKVQHPVLPNHRAGWIRAAAARVYGTDYDIVVSRARRVARLRNDGRTVFRFPVAIGRPGNETPLGRFAVTDKLRTTDPSSPYGCCAVALTGHQPKLVPGWPGGDRLAIHGTPDASSIGQAASLGCLRAGRTALERLFRRMPIGAPVFIRGR